MKLNVNNWGSFKYSDIFKVCHGFYNKKPDHIKPGNIPFLGATDKNNGVTEYYSLHDIDIASKTGKGKNVSIDKKIFSGHALCVTNNGAPGYAYYQDKEFTCSHDVNPLYIKNGDQFDKDLALFVATVIEQDRYRWQYGRKWRPKRMVNSIIKLPQDKNGNPDWDFMRKYIKSLHCNYITTKIKPKKVSLDIDDWQTFKIKDLFKPVYGVNLELSYLQQTNKDDPEGVAFVSRIEGNNGISAYVKKIPDVEPQPAGLLTIAAGGSVLSTYYQFRPFYSGRDLYLLEPKEEMTKLTLLFIKTVIETNKYRYNYGRQANKTLSNIELKLPATANGNLDTKFIDNYMNNLTYSDRI